VIPVKILAAAIKHRGKIYVGRRHYEIGLAMLRTRVAKAPYPSGEHQGFVDDTGQFVGRFKASNIAIRCGQVEMEKAGHNGLLFSEDFDDPEWPYISELDVEEIEDVNAPENLYVLKTQEDLHA
jgi:hypothetical protein